MWCETAAMQKATATCAGNKLWEWVSFGRYGTGGYDVRQQVSWHVLYRYMYMS